METRGEIRKLFLILDTTSVSGDLIERFDQAGDNGHGTIGSNEINNIFDIGDLIRLLVVNPTVTLIPIDDLLLGAGKKFVELTSQIRKDFLLNLFGTKLGGSFDLVGPASNSTTVLLKILESSAAGQDDRELAKTNLLGP